MRIAKCVIDELGRIFLPQVFCEQLDIAFKDDIYIRFVQRLEMVDKDGVFIRAIGESEEDELLSDDEAEDKVEYGEEYFSDCSAIILSKTKPNADEDAHCSRKADHMLAVVLPIELRRQARYPSQLQPGSVVWLYVEDNHIVLRYFGEWEDLDRAFRLKREKLFLDCLGMDRDEIWEETEEYRDALRSKRMTLRRRIGPFFYIDGRCIAHSIPDWQGEKRGGKLDNPYSHEALYDDHFHDGGDYIDIPRGRVVWDTEADRAIIYLDRCIEKIDGAVEKIAKRFDLTDYVVEHDEHYVCPNCMGDIWEA